MVRRSFHFGTAAMPAVSDDPRLLHRLRLCVTFLFLQLILLGSPVCHGASSSSPFDDITAEANGPLLPDEQVASLCARTRSWTKPLRILSMGDSITSGRVAGMPKKKEAFYSYRRPLFHRLILGGAVWKTDFVMRGSNGGNAVFGPQPDDDFDNHNTAFWNFETGTMLFKLEALQKKSPEARPFRRWKQKGQQQEQEDEQQQLTPIEEALNGDVVFLMFGTNDVFPSRNTYDSIAGNMLSLMRLAQMYGPRGNETIFFIVRPIPIFEKKKRRKKGMGYNMSRTTKVEQRLIELSRYFRQKHWGGASGADSTRSGKASSNPTGSAVSGQVHGDKVFVLNAAVRFDPVNHSMDDGLHPNWIGDEIIGYNIYQQSRMGEWVGCGSSNAGSSCINPTLPVSQEAPSLALTFATSPRRYCGSTAPIQPHTSTTSAPQSRTTPAVTTPTRSGGARQPVTATTHYATGTPTGVLRDHSGRQSANGTAMRPGNGVVPVVADSLHPSRTEPVAASNTTTAVLASLMPPLLEGRVVSVSLLVLCSIAVSIIAYKWRGRGSS